MLCSQDHLIQPILLQFLLVLPYSELTTTTSKRERESNTIPIQVGYGTGRIDIVSSNVVLGGVSTDKMPAEVFAIKLNNNFFLLQVFLTAAQRGEVLTFNGIGAGTNTEHSFDVLRPDDRVIIEVDEVIQSPLFRRKIDVELCR